jgi:hypothetical protein
LEMAHAVDTGGTQQREFFPGFSQDPLALGFGEEGVGLVFQRKHRLAFIAIAHPAFEGHARARAHVAERALQRGGFDRGRGNTEAHCKGQPPAAAMAASISDCRRRVSASAEMIRR